MGSGPAGLAWQLPLSGPSAQGLPSVDQAITAPDPAAGQLPVPSRGGDYRHRLAAWFPLSKLANEGSRRTLGCAQTLRGNAPAALGLALPPRPNNTVREPSASQGAAAGREDA